MGSCELKCRSTQQGGFYVELGLCKNFEDISFGVIAGVNALAGGECRMSCAWSMWQRSSCREGEGKHKQNWRIGIVPIATSIPPK